MKCLFSTLISFTLLIGCSKESLTSEYKYEVSGTSGNYSVTIQNADDNTQQWSEVGNGWWYSWDQTGTRWLYISAQNNNSSGSVTVKIIKEGEVISENTSFGGYTIATVSGDF
jgi:hypothetical protein